MIKLLASRVHQIFKILDICHLCVCRGYSKIMCSSILNSTKKVALHGNTCAYLSTLVHRFAHLMSHSGVQFLSTTWSSAQDEQKAHIEVSCLLENENLGWHGSHACHKRTGIYRLSTLFRKALSRQAQRTVFTQGWTIWIFNPILSSTTRICTL